MKTIVLNTALGAVSEYDWQFQSITPTHAGDAAGLFALGGDDDAGLPIQAELKTARKVWDTTLKKSIAAVYLSLWGAGDAAVTVHGATGQWRYTFPVRASGVSRALVGRGIRENYLALSLENIAGAAFSLDRIELLDQASRSRRI